MEQLLKRVKNIILSPRSEWQAIKAEQAAARDIIFNYAAILAVIPPLASVVSIGVVGFNMGGTHMHYPLRYLLVWGVLWYVMEIVSIIVAGAAVNGLATSFESKKDSVRALKIVAYSFTPAAISSILGIIPALRILVLLVSLYGIYLFYLGLNPLMETPDNKTVGYTVVSCIAFIVVTVLSSVLVSVIAGLFMMTGVPDMGTMMSR